MDKKIIYIKDTSFTADRTKDVHALLLNGLRDRSMQDSVQAVRVADIGAYGQGVVVKVLPDTTYYGVKDEDLGRILESVKQGTVVKELTSRKEPKQLRIVLRNCGVIDPESIEEYMANEGYQALKKVLFELKTQDKVIEEMKKSGLRGRGGAGYPTWMKWNFAKQMPAGQKYVICNGDEGDPGAYMDRSILEGDPHSVVEGIMIAGFSVGASIGYFYIRAEYPLAVERIQKAIDQCYANGLLGKDILGSGFSFDLEIRLGAGAFVCGEETALIASIEGRRGTPHPRPPYPSVKGLWDRPTVINNVETLANVPYVINRGGDNFAKVGTQTSKGTKVFALTGKVKNSGLVEVPMGTTIREIVFDIGGGVHNNKNIKAVQTGGPSGGVIPKDFLDTPVDYENLQKLGSIMGSGGMIVMDEDDCMVDIARFYQRFCFDESCGKCSPCRIGTAQMLGFLGKISEGRGEIGDLDNLSRIAQSMQRAALCGLGQTAPNPVISTLRYYEDEYKVHILQKKCPSKKCRNLLSYKIITEKCKKCGLCFMNCEAKAITGNKDDGYTIDMNKCVRCGRCFEVCKFKAVGKE
ncbi:MAG: NADH-ubiquinone oxidoreductase-F iron-sulfur binding region domain-containing protein [Candidatus Omnitrophica bacterium]|nr:NADH-ubiquinone oxidoreductase-F iron-sulfur binding region domain-containing protein [Candidatus Omnitrophota bacterium]MDD5736922.1 NADH-ubiquinone oxidoreductase-F iron-sulfur binding region domain-containing protein [Candidatus Omnitrophota bacterium]